MQNHCNAVLECLQYDTIALWQWVEFFYQMMHVFKNCLCICCHSSTGLSYFSTVSKWLNMASNFCHVVAHNLSFLIPNIDETVIGSSMLSTGEMWKIHDFWPVSRCRGSETETCSSLLWHATTSVLVASVPVILGQPVALSFHRPHVPEENHWGTSISANSMWQWHC